MVKILALYLILLQLVVSWSQESVELISVNSKLKGNVYGPAFFKDRLVVCSDHKEKLTKTIIDERGYNTTNLYVIIDTTGKFESFDKTINSNFNEGPVTFDGTSEYMILSRNMDVSSKLTRYEGTSNLLGLFESSINGATWSNPKLLSFVNPNYHYTHPGLNEAGDFLVFASNCPGGFGGFDIWTSHRTENGWSTPVNAGSNVNSASNELFPSFDNKSIYFSSDRQGMGGLDIYTYDTLNKKTQMMESPINSEQDDFGLVCRQNKSKAYFASNRTGKDKIWSFSIEEPELEVSCNEMIPNNLCYNLTEQQASELGEVGSLIYKWHINEVIRYGISIDYCFPGEGGYEITLDIIDTIVNQTYYNQSYYYIEILFEQQPYITSKDTVLIGEDFTLSAAETNLPDAIIDSYQWRISDGREGTGETFKYKFTSPGDYQVELTVGGKENNEDFAQCVYKIVHCTNANADVASDPQDLLNDTSKVVRELQYFEERDDSSNVVYSIEVIRTDKKLGSDNFLFKLMETYGEVKIHYVEETKQYSYLIGEWDNLEDAHPTWKELLERGYDKAIVRSIDLDKIAKFSLDNAFVLESVRFDEAQWDIRQDAIEDLQNVIEILLIFPDIELIVEAHTDSDGPDDFNLELSRKRADSVKNYLVTNGVKADRIQAKGYGETRPKTTNETAEGKELNRRVEFTFLK